MSKDVLSKIRAGDVWKHITRVLSEYRVEKADYQVEDKRPHPALTVTYCGITRTMHFAGTPGSRNTARVTGDKLRKMLKAMRFESMAPMPVVSHYRAPEPVPAQFLSLMFENNELRIHDHAGQPWFILADVCRALDLSNPSMVAKALDDDEQAKVTLSSGPTTVVSEGGLYSIVLRTRAATTPGTLEHRFRKWVTGVLLPSVRRGAPAVDSVEKRLIALERRAERKPSLDFSETVTASTVVEMAGIENAFRLPGLPSIITLRLKDFCLHHGYQAQRTPADIDPGERWRFPRAAANEWLTGDSKGGDLVRSMVMERRRKTFHTGSALAVVGNPT